MFEIIDSDSERTFILKKSGDSFQLNLLEEKINEFIKNDDRDLVLDLADLSLLDSSSLAAYIRFKRKLKATGRTMKLINYNESILRVIELSGLDDFLLD
ncbi:MAG TPA: STAS domain-containing protein [Spirochaetota bacterium]|nr:STAS domain-containing protein [Spirochaetota bacterium]HPS85264.1 STAS domain-containing protein [Spirochaetota bacterium]